MKDGRKRAWALLLFVTTIGLWIISAGIGFAQKKARAAFAKPERTAVTDTVRADVVVLKFHEGTRIRLQANQLIAAPTGINVPYARNFTGGRGNGVRMIDMETGWNLDHEDLPAVFHGSGVNNPFEREHGTAVLGILAAGENAYGITGIAPASAIGVSSAINIGITPYDVPGAINRAAGVLSAGGRRGDIILIEQHYPGPTGGATCNTSCGNCGQFGYVAMENFQADFDAIRNATALGIIVVEAAGNGQMNLDAAQYAGRFNRLVRDSGAILVGAGTSTGRSPWCWSNAGSRVDVQGWGDGVMTLGYGTSGDTPNPAFRINGTDVRQWYTPDFSGTSSATPIVAGAAAIMQGGTTTANVAMMGLGAVAGRVTRTTDGAPIAGANVVLGHCLTAGCLTLGAVTDRGGNYRINNLSAGTYQMEVSAAGYVSQTRTGISVALDSTTTVNFALAATPGAIAGQVTNAAGGAPIGGATVTVSPGGQSTVTGRNGYYSLPNLSPGAYSRVYAQ